MEKYTYAEFESKGIKAIDDLLKTFSTNFAEVCVQHLYFSNDFNNINYFKGMRELLSDMSKLMNEAVYNTEYISNPSRFMLCRNTLEEVIVEIDKRLSALEE